MGKHLITTEEFVLCPICNDGKHYRFLDRNHLSKHEKTLDDIRKEFPNVPTCCDSVNKKAQENRIKKLQEKYPHIKGIVNVSQIKEIANKAQDTKKSDPDHYLKRAEKIKKTNLKKYGKEWVFQTEEFINNVKEKMSNKTEEEKSEIIKKLKKTKLKNYGDENYNNRDKAKKTNNVLYGGNAPTCSKEVIEKREIKRNNKMEKRILQFLETINLKLLDDKYEGCYHHHKFKCLKCNYEFEQLWNSIQQGFTCPNCRPIINDGISKSEKDLQTYIESFNFKSVSFNNRTLINPWELDIVIHDLKIAIEYNGLFYHHEKIIEETRKNLSDPKKYHFMKYELCLKKGYRLITIFEDEFVFNKNIVFGRLNQILNVKTERIHARECEIKEIQPDVKNDFLNTFHLLGADSSTVKLGAFFESQLISVMTFSKGNIAKGSTVKEDVWELNRFCTNYNYHIPGLGSKFLEYFKKNFKWVEIFSYADLRWSNGDLYRKLGFECDNKIRLNYWYIDLNKVKRIHRYALRKNENDPKDIPENILRISEGYKILWDCGNLKFTLKNK